MWLWEDVKTDSINCLHQLLNLCTFSRDNALLQSVWYPALRAMINWADSCWDSTELPGSLHFNKFTMYCKIWMGLLSLYALFLALWCWCLYIYTVWLVYCAIVLHVWNKLEWAWWNWKWAGHLYFLEPLPTLYKEVWQYAIPVKYYVLHF